jgi:hypothetical protein
MALNSQDLLVDSSPAHAQIVSKPPTLHMRWSGEWFALAFGDLCLRFVGDLAFAYSSRFQRIGICSGDPGCDHCSQFSRSASFLLLASQRYASFASRGTCSG